MERSKFWLKIYEEDGYTNIFTNEMVKGLVNLESPELVRCSPTGWKLSKSYDDVFYLWIPDDRMDWASLEKLKLWAERANKHIWLKTNKNTSTFFCGKEVDYCLAADWNFDIDTGDRTVVGNAEYQLKYQLPRGMVSDQNAAMYAKTLSSAITDCIECIPINLCHFLVTAIPAVKEKHHKLAWQLAKYISNVLDAPFVEATLTKDKPQMKEQTVADKVNIWRDILDDESMVNLSQSVCGKDILIIDDLYQSGASIWCFAEYLKEQCGARTVIAITAVKSLKDGDNK